MNCPIGLLIVRERREMLHISRPCAVERCQARCQPDHRYGVPAQQLNGASRGCAAWGAVPSRACSSRLAAGPTRRDQRSLAQQADFRVRSGRTCRGSTSIPAPISDHALRDRHVLATPCDPIVNVPSSHADRNERRWSLRAVRANPSSGRIERSCPPVDSTASRNVYPDPTRMAVTPCRRASASSSNHFILVLE